MTGEDNIHLPIDPSYMDERFPENAGHDGILPATSEQIDYLLGDNTLIRSVLTPEQINEELKRINQKESKPIDEK